MGSWLGSALFIARKDVRYALRQRETVLWTFVMPILFFYFIGTITAGFGGPGDAQDELAVLFAEEGGFLQEQLARRLEEQDFELVRVAGAEEQAAYARRLTVPAGLTAGVLAGETRTVSFTRREGGIAGDYDTFRVGRAVYTLLADLAVVSQGTADGTTIDAAAIDALDAAPRALTLAVERAGERKAIPSGFEQAVPGTMVMFTLLVLLTSGAVMIVIERREGLLRRLASAPISRGAIVAGKWGGKMALGIVQIAFAMAAGTLLFRMDWGPNLPMLLAVLLAWASLAASLGILSGTLARTDGQAIGIGVLAANVLAALGGCWWPIEITPAWMQKLSLFLPTGTTMDALHKLVSFGDPAASVLPHIVALAAAALVAGAVAARKFRFQ